MTSSEIRTRFLDFFEKRGHTIVPSSSLIPDDPSVLLTTAGMQQFKLYFTGDRDAKEDFGALATASVQKSFRTSDIDEVGDESHLTFFEMLGNFSFGGYFKKEAIEYAYEFITKEMRLTISYVTVFEGKEDIGVPTDTESRDIWKSLDPKIQVVEQGMDDVFWGPTGSSGPCGPTTEIYVKNAAGQDVEIWNIVFNEYFYPGSREELNQGVRGKKLEPLTMRGADRGGVDTGMGLERLTMVVQRKKNIFETDLFQNPFHLFLSGGSYEREAYIIADHVRAAIFLLSDGVRPSNKGTGYILRRLIRRAFVQLQRLQFSKDSLFDSISRVIQYYGDFYPELKEHQEIVKKEFILEVSNFEKTLVKGTKEFFAKFPEMKAQELRPGQAYPMHHIKRISGEDAFHFHQSYGLTLDVIKDLAKRGGHIVEVDEREFERAMEKHKEVSRAGSEAKFGGHGLYMKTGEVTIRDESEVEKVTRLHTATHLMHAALRAILGPEVRQNGSDITVDRTRFDFNFPRKVTPDELKKVEAWVNDAIKKDLKVEWKEMSYDEAIAEGALGFFKARYPTRVKVYTMFDEKSDEVYSKELCGGPHVEHTKDVGTFKITKEESSSAGVRRIRGIIE